MPSSTYSLNPNDFEADPKYLVLIIFQYVSLRCGGFQKQKTGKILSPISLTKKFTIPVSAYLATWASQVVLVVKNLPANSGDIRDLVRSLGWEDPLEEVIATHSSILAWRIPMDRGAWQDIVHSVTKSQTRLKQLSMHTHI